MPFAAGQLYPRVPVLDRHAFLGIRLAFRSVPVTGQAWPQRHVCRNRFAHLVGVVKEFSQVSGLVGSSLRLELPGHPRRRVRVIVAYRQPDLVSVSTVVGPF